LIGLTNHLVYFLISKLLTEVGCAECNQQLAWTTLVDVPALRLTHHVPEFRCTDLTVVVLVEHLESLHDLFLRVSVLHLTRHHGQELGEIDGVVAVRVDL
jgi:hypothetical protein